MAVFEQKSTRLAPNKKTGIIFFLKEKLFSSPFNSFLTIVGIYILYLIAIPFVDWAFVHAVWTGKGKETCLDIHGACWIYIADKLNLFLYGFYPAEYHWRPNLVIIITLGYVIFFSLSVFKKFYKSKVVLIAIYPFICWVILHGGVFGIHLVDTSQWGGLLLTVVLGGSAIILSFPIGILMALGRRSEMPVIRSLSIIYIEFIRGVPLITLLFMASVILPLFFDESITFDKLLRALIGLTMFQSAYLAEVLRGGLQAIPKGQFEASVALGLNYWQRMLLVILPQALKISIPNIIGASISLFKDTTLVLIIGLFDLLAMVNLNSNDPKWLGFEAEGYVFVAFIFWVFCFGMSRYSKFLEDKYNTNRK